MSFFLKLNIIGIIFISGLFTGIYWFGLYDKGESIIEETESVRNEIVQVNAKMNKKKEELKKVIDFDNSVKRMGKEIEYFLSYVPKSLTTLDMHKDITQMAQKSGLDIKSMKHSSRGQKTEMYDTISVNLTAEGEFAQILIFLSYLTDLDRIIVVQNMDISPVSGGPRGGKSRKIQARMNLVGFRYLESEAKNI